MTSQNETLQPYGWLKQIPSSLLQHDEIPLFGNVPEFPWNEFSESFSKSLGGLPFSAKMKRVEWRTGKELLKGFSNPQSLFFTVDGIDDSLSLIFSKKDLLYIISNLLHVKDEKAISINHELFIAFYEFLAIEAINSLSEINFDPSLSIQLNEEGELPSQVALCIDVEVTIFSRTIYGRFLLSSTFRKTWAERYAFKNADSHLDFFEKLHFIIELEIAQLSFPPDLWNQVNIGDFLPLQNCTIDPEKKSGTLRMLVKGMPFHVVEMHDRTLKILDDSELLQLTNNQEVNKAMVKDNDNHDDFDDEDEEFELEDDDDFDDDDFDDDDFDDDDYEDDDFDDDEEDYEDDDDFEEETESKAVSKEEKAEASNAEPKEIVEKVVAEPATTPVSIYEIPLSISVEMGRFQLSVKKLAELQPGNLLELDVQNHNLVDLILSGKCIAKGELLKIGSTLGVRITEKH